MRYFTAIVSDNEDPDKLGRLRVICPQIYGDEDTEIPAWIPAQVGAGAGPGAGWFFVPPVDSIVFIDRDPAGGLSWLPGPWGQVNTVPDALAENYPHRAGFTSPDGAHVLILDDDTGLLILAAGAELTMDAAAITLAHKSIRLVSSSAALDQPLMLGRSFLTDLATFLAACVADAALSPGVAAGAAVLLALVNTSLASGAPHLSTISATE